jgi:uncharacterized phiE125 gp8 family phage protein
MSLVIATEPAVLPVTLTEAKTHLRVDHGDEDTLIIGYLTAARERCELEARRTFINTTFDLFLDYWPSRGVFRLPRPPLVSVTGIYYTDTDAVEATYDALNYLVDNKNQPGKVVLKSSATWPSVTLQEINGVRVRFVAGYGATPSSVPERYRQAILLLAGHYYENRESVLVAQGFSAVTLPDSVSRLLQIDRGGFF